MPFTVSKTASPERIASARCDQAARLGTVVCMSVRDRS